MFGVDRNIEQSWKKLVFDNFKYRNLLFSSLPYANWTFKSQAKRAISCCVFEKKNERYTLTWDVTFIFQVFVFTLERSSSQWAHSVLLASFQQLAALEAKTTIAFRILFFAQNVNSLNTFICQKPSEQKPQKRWMSVALSEQFDSK